MILIFTTDRNSLVPVNRESNSTLIIAMEFPARKIAYIIRYMQKDHTAFTVRPYMKGSYYSNRSNNSLLGLGMTTLFTNIPDSLAIRAPASTA